jgi:hypothetical protein
MAKGKPPAPIVRLEAKGLIPVSGWDAELLNEMANGTEFDLVKRSNRSDPHHRTYWKALHMAVAATHIKPTARHLHRSLKICCGYTEEEINLDTGELMLVPDSIAYDEMSQEEFKMFFDITMAKLAEWIGYDPLRFMEAA